jgi:hypothetical protein
MAVAVTEIGKVRFKEMRIHDPAGHFKGRAIRVTGVATIKENRPQIEVDDPRQRCAVGVGAGHEPDNAHRHGSKVRF